MRHLVNLRVPSIALCVACAAVYVAASLCLPVRRALRCLSLGPFPELHSAGGEETAEQSTRDPFLHPDRPARGNTPQPV